MTFRQDVQENHFSTAAERCIAAQYVETGDWRNAIWRSLAPEHRRESFQRALADIENARWNTQVRFDWDRRWIWDREQSRGRSETDEEFGRRKATLKWRPNGDRFEYLGDQVACGAAAGK